MKVKLASGRRAMACQIGAIAIAASSSLLSSPAAQAASAEIVVPAPATVLSLGLATGAMHDELRGVLCEAPRICTPVKYPRVFYPAGADPLNASIRATQGPKVILGYSQGGQVISAWMRKYANQLNAPSADELVFVMLGNGDRPHGGSNAQSGFATPQTQYKVIDVARQYDFAADFPDDPWNLLAFANALAGFSSIHMNYEDVDLYDPNNIVWTEGNTTYVFVPTENLPLLNPLRALGFNKLADRLNGPLKEIIERGYNRDYLPRPITSPPAPEVPPVVVEDPAEVPSPVEAPDSAEDEAVTSTAATSRAATPRVVAVSDESEDFGADEIADEDASYDELDVQAEIASEAEQQQETDTQSAPAESADASEDVKAGNTSDRSESSTRERRRSADN